MRHRRFATGPLHQPMQTEITTPAEPGIYRLTIGPRTFYWGQAQNLWRRKHQHLHFLRRGTHHNRHLQASFNKHGEEAFTFDVSLICEVEELNRYEQHFIDRDHGFPGCANIAKCVEAPARGLKHSDEARAKMAAARQRRCGAPTRWSPVLKSAWRCAR